MELGPDLSPEALAAALPGRPVRGYPALVSTEADALAWARAGAPEGAVVVAEHQLSPRGRGGWLWNVTPGASLAFSVVLRPGVAAAREGWIYTVAVTGLADALGEEATIEWPEEVRIGGERAGAVAVQTELGEERVEWAVVNVLVVEAPRPRAPLLARILEAIEERARAPAAAVLSDYVPRCETLGRAVCARLIPLGPAGQRVTGTARRALADGALVIETGEGRRVAVPPQSLGVLEEATVQPVEGPSLDSLG